MRVIVHVRVRDSPCFKSICPSSQLKRCTRFARREYGPGTAGQIGGVHDRSDALGRASPSWPEGAVPRVAFYDTPGDEHIICVDEMTGMQILEQLCPDIPMTAEDNVRQLYACVARLAPLDRLLVSLYLEEMGTAEIGAVLGISDGNEKPAACWRKFAGGSRNWKTAW